MFFFFFGLRLVVFSDSICDTKKMELNLMYSLSPLEAQGLTLNALS